MPNRNVVAANGDGGGSGGGGGALDTAAAALNLPTLPPWIARRQKSMVTAGSLSLLGAFLTFVCFNQTELVIDLLVLEMKSTIAWWTLCCVCVGFSIASVVFYLRQGLLAASVERERASLAALQQTHAALSAAYDRLRNVAASVCVPLPLDQFVEKAGANAEQLSDIVYKPRQILAHRASAGQRSE